MLKFKVGDKVFITSELEWGTICSSEFLIHIKHTYITRNNANITEWEKAYQVNVNGRFVSIYLIDDLKKEKIKQLIKPFKIVEFCEYIQNRSKS
jgi:hypothetical protein